MKMATVVAGSEAVRRFVMAMAETQGLPARQILPLLLNIFYLAPALALVNNSVKASQRTMSSAILLMILNFIGLGAGPTIVGELSTFFAKTKIAAGVDAALAEVSLIRVNPFRLIGVFPRDKTVVEWRWNLQRLECLAHPWQTNIWISSGFDEPGAQRMRGKSFSEALRQRSTGSTEWLRRLHRSHGPERGPCSICMHREDAATVSYTEVIVTRQSATLRYAPGAPCCAALQPALTLAMIRRSK